MVTTFSKRRRLILTEAMLVYTCTIGLIVLLYQMRGLSVINRYLWTLAMLLQVYVPAWMLQRQAQTLSVYGLHFHGWRKSIRFWLLSCVVFLIPTVFGHHIWQSYNGHPIQEKEISYRQYRYGMRGKPPSLQHKDQVQIYAERLQPTLTIRWKAPLSGTLQTDGKLTVISGGQWVQGARTGKKIKISGGGFSQTTSVQLRVRGKYLRHSLKRDGVLIPSYDIRLGPQLQATKSHKVERDFGWIFYLLIAQCLMVALPEELFYRGYLQTRLDLVFPVRTIFGIPMSWGNLIVSVLFALTHFLIGFEPHRLSVFFPSLLFGALKHRTNSLLAPILFHATANILVKMLEIWYQ